MTKALIYDLVSGVLRLRNHVHVFHTCAKRYFPDDEDLEPIASILSQKLIKTKNPSSLRETFSRLDQMVTGEKGPYEYVEIGPNHTDPSQPVFLAALVSLKLGPPRVVFEHGEVESSVIIYPEHSAGAMVSRSIIAAQLAEYVAQLYNGQQISIPSLDHTRVFCVLSDFHRRHSLENPFNFEISLTGTKMHTVGSAMFAATVQPARVHYAKASGFDPTTFTKGTADSFMVSLNRIERQI